jgi:transcriptional regulator with PAS, ATPase and Fis domain
MANENKFRLDLFHRLSIFVIEIPPLRERKEDIPILMEYFLNYFTQKMNKLIPTIDERVFEIIKSNPIPGNVRQLRNCMERAVIMCEGDSLLPEHFRMETDMYTESVNGASPVTDSIEVFNLEANERKLIQLALDKSGNNKSKAAELLNITWQSLDRRMKKFGME